jgi:hypothetical protein
VDVFAFAPGIDPSSTEVTLDRGLLTVAGERASGEPDRADDTRNVYGQERFSGRFRRTVRSEERRRRSFRRSIYTLSGKGDSSLERAVPFVFPDNVSVEAVSGGCFNKIPLHAKPERGSKMM